MNYNIQYTDRTGQLSEVLTECVQLSATDKTSVKYLSLSQNSSVCFFCFSEIISGDFVLHTIP